MTCFVIGAGIAVVNEFIYRDTLYQAAKSQLSKQTCVYCAENNSYAPSLDKCNGVKGEVE